MAHKKDRTAKDRTTKALTRALAASAAIGGLATPVFAQAPGGQAVDTRQQTRRFDIPAGRLDSAVAGFARATGISVTDPDALTDAARSPGASGLFTPDEALHRLLAGTGVTYKFTNIRSITLARGPLPATLAAVTITADREAKLSSLRYTEPLADVPRTVTVIPGETMAAQGVTSLRDALKNVPGITINAGEGGSPPGDNFNIRGFSARSDLFVDGVRDLGGYSRDAFDLEQVEVAEGPASAFSGRGSTGGAINLVTKTPHLGESRAASLSGGSAPNGRVTADVNQPLDAVGMPDAALRVNVMRTASDVAGDDRIHNSSWGVAPSLALGLGHATQLDLSYVRSTQDNLPAYGLSSVDSVPHVDTRHFFGLPNLDFERVNASQATARLDHEFGNGVHVRDQLTTMRSATGRIVTAANLADGTRASKTHRSTDSDVDQQLDVAATLGSGVLQHDVDVGVDLSHERSMFGHYTIAGTPPAVGDLSNPDPAFGYTPLVTLTPNPRQVSANSLGAYAFDTFKIGQRLELNGGARWDTFAPTFEDSVTHAVPRASNLSGRVGVVVTPAERASVYAAYGTSFNPSIQNLAYDNLNTLPPEENRSIEVGSKWSLFKRRLLATVSLFRTDKTNARTRDPDDPSVNILAGKQRVQGAEVSASGQITSRWNLLAGYTRLDSKVLASGTAAQVGTELTNTPPSAENLWTTYRFPWQIEVGGGVQAVSRRLLRAPTYVPAYHTMDMMVSKGVGRGVALQLNLHNLTDELYYDNGRYWVPAPGRSATLTTTVTF